MYEYVYMYVPRNMQNLTSSSCYNTGATERYDMYVWFTKISLHAIHVAHNLLTTSFRYSTSSIILYMYKVGYTRATPQFNATKQTTV